MMIKLLFCFLLLFITNIVNTAGPITIEDVTEFYTYNVGPPSLHFKSSNNYGYANSSGICERYFYILIKSNEPNGHIVDIKFPSAQGYAIKGSTIISNYKNENKTMLVEVLVHVDAGTGSRDVLVQIFDNVNSPFINMSAVSYTCEDIPTIPTIQFGDFYFYRHPFNSEYITTATFLNYKKYPYAKEPNNILLSIPDGLNNITAIATTMEYKYVSSFKFKLTFTTTHNEFTFTLSIIGSASSGFAFSSDNLLFDSNTELMGPTVATTFSKESFNCKNVTYGQCFAISTFDTQSASYFIAAFDGTDSTSDSVLTFPVYGKPGNFTQLLISILKDGVTSGGVRLASYENTQFGHIFSHIFELISPINFAYISNFEMVPNADIETVTAVGCINRYDLSNIQTFQGDIKLDGFKIARFAQKTSNQIPFPYGYKNSTSNTYYIELMTPVSKYLNQKYITYSFAYTDWQQVYGILLSNQVPFDDLVAPIVTDLQYLNSYPTIKHCTIRVTVSDEISGVRSVTYTVMDSTMKKVIYIYNGYYSNIIQGLGNKECTFDLPIPKQYLVYNFKIKVSDYAGNNNEYSINSALTNMKRIESPPLKKLELSDIVTIIFQHNDINVTGDGPHTNSLIIQLNTTTVPNYKEYIFEFNPIYHINFYNQDNGGAEGIENSQQSPPSFTSVWDEVAGYHVINFTIPARLFTGVVPYYIHPLHLDSSSLYTLFNASLQLRVSSDDADVMPPMVSSIMNFNANIPKPGDPPVEVGFEINFKDYINGLVEANVTITSDVNLKGISFTFKKHDIPLGNGVLDCKFKIISLDIPQNYSISYISLKDSSGHISKYPDINYINPLAYWIEHGGYWFKTEYQPGVVVALDITPPELTSFQSVSTINESINQVEFTFSVEDGESGILITRRNEDYSPIVYLTDSNNLVLSGVTTLVRATGTNNQTVWFSSVIKIPYGFGYGENLLISIYGIYNNHMVLNGYSAFSLSELGFTNNIVVNYSDNPLITSINTIIDTAIFVDGFRFGVAPIVQFVNILNSTDVYSSSAITGLASYTDSSLFSFNFELKSIPALFSKPIIVEYYVNVIDSFGGVSASNINHKVIIIGSQVPTPTPFPSISPAPTNKPQACIGTPECGGNGICSSIGCICNSPWIGNDCTSKVLIVPPPVKNPTVPTTEIPITDVVTNSDEGSEPSNNLFKSLISIVSIRELDFNQNIVKNFTFDKWVFQSIDENTSNYTTSITVIPKSNNDAPTITNITVTLQWYKNETTVKFANEEIIMKASSMKYTIDISSYKFENNLNLLQLLMLASLESSKTSDICSSSEFGETSSGDNSNYIKIQIDNKSLYGRFIKRAIVDGYVLTIDNIPLDQLLNPIKQASTLQSYIGITIPNYKSSVTIDPDFSVLVNSNSVSNDDENSICSNNDNSNGLSTPQLAGIIVASVVIGCAIIGTAAFTFIKKSTSIRIAIKKIKMKTFKSI